MHDGHSKLKHDTQRKHMLEYVLKAHDEPLVFSPVYHDTIATHSVCAYEGMIYDSGLKHAMPLSHASLAIVCDGNPCTGANGLRVLTREHRACKKRCTKRLGMSAQNPIVLA